MKPDKVIDNDNNLSGIRSVLAKLEVDRAVIFTLLTRSWQAVNGAVSLLLIIRYFSPELQGFYYTFSGLLALQVFVELGFYLVIINVSSHEWAKLGLDTNGRITGSEDARSRLVSLGRFIFKWYAIASVVFIVGVSIGGYQFLLQAKHADINWQLPWISVVVSTGLVLFSLPFISLLEGCNQVVSVNRFRMIQAVLASLALWVVIIRGGELWAAVASSCVIFLSASYFLLWRYRRFFESFFKKSIGPHVHWKSEIWPMQWRLGLQGLVNYFMYWLFVPVMFHYHGAVTAGRMGMTWQLVMMVQVLALAWVHTKVPRFGMHIAHKNYDALDRLWWRTSLVSMLFIALASGAIWLAVYLLDIYQISFAQRLLGPLPTGLLLLAVILAQATQCQAAYLRAHKREALVVPGVLSGIASGLLVWFLGSRFGPIGAASAYLAVVALITFPLVTMIWSRARIEWHKT